MNTQKCVTTTMDSINNQTISIRQCTEANVKVKQIYEIMKYKTIPFYRKKSVVVPEGLKKITHLEFSTLRIYGCNVG